MDGFEEETAGDPPPPDATDRVLEGFDAPPAPVAAGKPSAALLPESLSIDGFLKAGASLNVAHHAPAGDRTDWRGLSRLQTALQLELSVRPPRNWQAFVSGKGFYDAAYRIRGRGDFTDAVLDGYEDELELREAWILVNPVPKLDVKIGRQIAVWGKSDNIRVTDVLNPLDLREPGLTDIEDLRLPVTMTRMDFYAGPWRLTGMAIHEVRFNKTPAWGHDFYPAQLPPPPEETSSDGGRNTEFALSASRVFGRADAALYAARFFDDTPHLTAHPDGSEWRQTHSRLRMAGMAGNLAVGNFLIKGEAAFVEGVEFFNRPDRSFSRTDLLAGMEYSGFTETMISVEAVVRHLHHHDAVLERSPDNTLKNAYQAVIRVEREFMNDALKLTLLGSLFGWTGKDGAFERISAAYDLADGVTLTGGFVLYQSGDLPEFRNMGRNDRLFVEVRYDF